MRQVCLSFFDEIASSIDKDETPTKQHTHIKWTKPNKQLILSNWELKATILC